MRDPHAHAFGKVIKIAGEAPYFERCLMHFHQGGHRVEQTFYDRGGCFIICLVYELKGAES